MPREIDPRETSREAAYHLWMGAPNPMVTVFKTLDVTGGGPAEQTAGAEIPHAAGLLHRPGCRRRPGVLHPAGGKGADPV